MNIFRNIRFYVLSFNVLISVVIYFYYRTNIPDSSSLILKVADSYALLSIFYLYLAMLATPFTRFFTSFSWKGQYLKSRRAIGVVAFYFALLHSLLSFFGLLGGFEGLGFLSAKYLIAIGLSVFALVILALMASTSLDFMIDKLSFPRWKLLHRLVYLAGIATLIHALMLGSHFSNLLGIIPIILFVAVAFLLILESFRLDNYLRGKYPLIPNIGISFGMVILLIAGFAVYLFLPTGDGSSRSFDIHAQHIQLAKDALQQNQTSTLTPSLLQNPALIGDKTRRYTVSFIHDDNILPNQDTTLKFRINDASSGNPVDLFQRVYAYPMHLMVADSTLSFFEHIHPTQQNDEFVITTQFAKPGLYHLYIQYQPLGAIEQQVGFTLPVGEATDYKIPPSTQVVDTNYTKTFGDYEVTLDTHGNLNAADMSIGKDTLSFTIKDAKTKNPITTLKPYMASFGHLTMINEQTYDFIHVHPTNLTPPAPDANGGPSVDFLPIGIYGPFKPGIYRAFGEFSTQIGTNFTVDFTVNIK